MAQFFINTSIFSQERVDLAKFLDVGADNVFDPLTSGFLERLYKLKSVGKYVVTADENRADLISYKVYNASQYWWIILYYNRLLTTDDLPAGLVLTYPSIESIESLIFTLKAEQVANNV